MFHFQLCVLPLTHQYESTTLSLKSTHAIKVATMKITDDFHYKWKPLGTYHQKLTLFAASKDSKEDTGI